MPPWSGCYHYYTTSFNKAWTPALRRFKSYSRRDGDSGWWESLTMVPVKYLSSVNHTTKIMHDHFSVMVTVSINPCNPTSTLYLRIFICFFLATKLLTLPGKISQISYFSWVSFIFCPKIIWRYSRMEVEKVPCLYNVVAKTITRLF